MGSFPEMPSVNRREISESGAAGVGNGGMVELQKVPPPKSLRNGSESPEIGVIYGNSQRP